MNIKTVTIKRSQKHKTFLIVLALAISSLVAMASTARASGEYLDLLPSNYSSGSTWSSPATTSTGVSIYNSPTFTAGSGARSGYFTFAGTSQQWKGTLTIKGVQNVEDAKKAADLGVDAVLLSNHGGRQLDRAPVPLHLIQEVRKELKSNLEVHIDTGIMHGADVLAAIALGAQYTYVGRAFLFVS